jgi:hypothetical protein
MVRVRVRVSDAVRAVVDLQCLDAIDSANWYENEYPRGMPLANTRARASSGAKAWQPMSANARRKTRTVKQLQPDDPNPNTAGSRVKNAHRTVTTITITVPSAVDFETKLVNLWKAFSVWTQF